MSSSIIYLFKERKFLPFFLTQFFGAFNDNTYKLAMLTLISYHLTQAQAQSEYYQALAGALFIAPFFVFSATAGQLADKYDKAFLIRWIKLLELLLMLLGSLALYSGSIFWMLFTLTGLGIHSTFFGPIKYAILPDHLPRANLLGATGLIDASTFIAILLGTILGTLAIGTHYTIPYLAMFLTIFTASIGLVASLFIPSTPSSLPTLKINFQFWQATTLLLSQATKQINIILSILILSWFWLIGTVLLTKLPDYTHYVLGANAHVFAIFLALFSCGIALGSLTVNLIFKGQINLRLVPWAMLLLTVFCFDLYWVSPTQLLGENLVGIVDFFKNKLHWRIAVDLFMLTFSAGLFVVPLYTYLQVISPSKSRARIIAANNIYNALFMVNGSLMVMLLLHFNIVIPQIFLTLSILNFFAAVAVFFGLKVMS